MTFALYADEWPMHMIRLKLERSDRHLFTELLTHCTRNLSDGVIDVPLALVTDHPDADAAVQRLIEAGLIESHPEGLVIAPDYLRNQRTKEQVEADREKNRQYQDAFRERGRLHGIGDHRKCTKGCPNQGKDLRKDLTKDVTKGVQSSPLLSDPKGGERGEVEVESDEPTGLAPVGLASSPDKNKPDPHVTVHAFSDSTFNGLCDFCALKKSNPMHQSELPENVLALAEMIAEQKAWSEITLNKMKDGYRYWYYGFTGPTFTGSLTTWPARGDDIGHIDGVDLRLPMPQPVPGRGDDEEMQPEWVAFNERVAAVLEEIAPGAINLDEQGVIWEDGDLILYLTYGISDDRHEQIEIGNKARKYLKAAFLTLTEPYFHKRLYACAQTKEAA